MKKYVIYYIAVLQKKLYNIALTHLERYIFMQREKELAYYLEERGCVFQLNQGSLIGDFGERCQLLAHRMLKAGIVRA